MKRALSGLLPPSRKSGEPAVAAVLFDALARASTDDPDALTHGFHVWPARMHRSIAAVVLEGLAGAGGLVVDPFCGGGTVLVEARVHGRAAVGVDLNPLALPVSEVKTDLRDASARARFATAAEAVVLASKERVKARAPSRAPVSRALAARWDPHVLKELAGLREEILAVQDPRDRRALEVVLSAILTKVSRARSDTDARQASKRIGRYIPTEIFAKKAQELVERWASLEGAVAALAAVAGGGPPPALTLAEHDALRLHEVVKDGSAALILSSPPYGGTYDYASHHAARMPWLGLDDRALQRGELGARRRASALVWEREVATMLSAMARALAPGGHAVLVMGDAEVAGERILADAQLARLAPRAGLRVVATASAPREDRRGGASRDEHLVALTRV